MIDTVYAVEPTLADILRDVWRARRAVITGAVAGLVCGLIVLAAAVPQYRASMLVSPTTRTGTPDISGLFPDNASFAMEYVLQSFGPGDSSDFMRFETILREPTIAAKLLQDENVRTGLARAGRWRFSARPPLDTPVKLAAWLQDNLQVEPVGATRLRRIVFRHPDPVFATLMLQSLYNAADTLIRAELEAKTARRIQYLNGEIAATPNPEHKRTLTKLLMDQEQIAMILAVHEPYAAQMAEPPAAASRPDWPRRTVIVPASLLLGMGLGYIVHALRRAA